MDELDRGNISTVAFVDLIHLNYLNDDICCSRKTLGLKLHCIVEDVIQVDDFDEVNTCCSMKVIQIRVGAAELCHTQTFYFENLQVFTQPPAWVQ